MKWDAVAKVRTSSGFGRNDPPSDSFGIEDYARKFGLSYPTAARELAALVRAGQLERGKFVVGGRRRWLFWIKSR